MIEFDRNSDCLLRQSLFAGAQVIPLYFQNRRIGELRNWACGQPCSAAGRSEFFFENEAVAFQFQERPHRQVEGKQKRIEFLEKKAQTEDEVLAELMAEYIALSKSWGTITGNWVPHDVRDQVVDFVRRWSEKTDIGVGRFIHWLGVTASKLYDRRERYGCVNEHNGSP